MFFPRDGLEEALQAELQRLEAMPLSQLLLDQGVLRNCARAHLLGLLPEMVSFTVEEQPAVWQRLREGLVGLPETLSLTGDWLSQCDPAMHASLQERWNQLRLQKWLEVNYGDQVEAHFLSRRSELERVVYGAIRVASAGLADELYLRLLGEEASFAALALEFSLGEERYTNGLVGPMTIDQPHPAVRQVLEKLAVGEVHPPFRLGNWFITLRLEHRLPARLDEATRHQLLRDLFQVDFDAFLEQSLVELMPSLHQERSGSLVSPSSSCP